MAGVENKPNAFPPSDLRLFQLPREMEQLLMAAAVAAGWQGGGWIPVRSRAAAPAPADALAARAASRVITSPGAFLGDLSVLVFDPGPRSWSGICGGRVRADGEEPRFF